VALKRWVTSEFEISDYGETNVEPLPNVPTYDHETIFKYSLRGPIFPL
jgi:hypothetical protein